MRGDLLEVMILSIAIRDGLPRPTCDYRVSCLTNAVSIDVGEFNHIIWLRSQGNVPGAPA